MTTSPRKPAQKMAVEEEDSKELMTYQIFRYILIISFGAFVQKCKFFRTLFTIE